MYFINVGKTWKILLKIKQTHHDDHTITHIYILECIARERNIAALKRALHFRIRNI